MFFDGTFSGSLSGQNLKHILFPGTFHEIDFAYGGGGQVTGTEEWQHDTAAEKLRGHLDDNTIVFLYADHGADREYVNSPLSFVNPKGWVTCGRRTS
jgi:hypothetical protein